MKKDNSTIRQKVLLRRALLRELDEEPVVMETHGGSGAISKKLYRDFAKGVVFEKDAVKADILARQRPTWAVYECDVVGALTGGAGSHLPVNFLDLDPYGEPWPAVEAFFGSERPWPEKLCVAVNDGLRQKVKMGGAWQVGSLSELVSEHGNAWLYRNYLEACRILLTEKAGGAGYRLTRWAGYYCGALQQMSHYSAVFTRAGSARSSGN